MLEEDLSDSERAKRQRRTGGAPVTMTVDEAMHRLMTRPCINIWPELGLLFVSAAVKRTRWFTVVKSRRFVLAG